MTTKENNKDSSVAKEINNVSYHEFLMPFFIKEDKNNNWKKNLVNFWEKVEDDNRFYFKVENDNSLANKNQRYGIQCGKNAYFNDSARKLLGLIKDDEYVAYNRKNVTDLKLLIEKDSHEYNLDVLNVMLYETAFKTYLLRITTKYNHQNNIKENILSAFNRINDYGRRVYLSNVSDYTNVNNARSLYTASKTCLYNNNMSVTAEFKPKYEETSNYGSEIINYLLFNDENSNLEIDGCLDDRMFVCATLVDRKEYLKINKNNDYICRLSNNIDLKSIKEKIDEELYKTIFIDGKSCSCFDKYKRNKDIADAIYTRWMPYSLYAITDYSYLHLTGNITSDNYYLIDNDINIYGDMATLSLLQRSTMLYVSNSLDNEENMNNRIVNLMKDINIMEVSEQIQGIEMYDIFKQKMNLERNITLLNEQLSAIHERDNEVVDDNLNLFMFIFTIMGVLDSVLSNDTVKRIIDPIKNFLIKKEVQVSIINLIQMIACFIIFVFCVLFCLKTYEIISNKKTSKDRKKATRLVKLFIIIVLIIKALQIISLI